MRETLYRELTLTQRVAFHRQVGEALESLSDAYPQPPLTELAYHFSLPRRVGRMLRKPLTYATQAGARATTLLAYEEATKHYQSALRLLNLKEPDEALRCDLLLHSAARSEEPERRKKPGRHFAAATIARKRGNSSTACSISVGLRQ